ncbi:MAG: Fic family protein, partial [Nanoarchaeota archaeon]|nr:Fic family protein [Nanoarchaeota archaeon]
MASIVTKNVKGKEYIYLVDSLRKGNKVIQKTIKYIGAKRPVLKEEFDCMNLSYKNQDWILNNYNNQLSYQDHQNMKDISDKYNEYLKSLDKISREKEKERFLSIFISNSNAIEGSTLTVKETFNYLFNDIAPKDHSKKELFMASNLLNAWNYLEKNCKKFPTDKDLFELHRLVNLNVEDEVTLGKYKKVQNYIGDVHTSSYLFVKEKMKKLFFWIKKSYKQVNDFEVAFQSHAQFEIIHPFVDGNGRVGRLLLNWLLIMKSLMPLA